MATQRELQKEKSTQAMFKAAIKEFSDKGYDGARLSDIAESAGVAKGLVSSRFGSKEDLFNHVLATILSEIDKEYIQYSSDETVLLSLASYIKNAIINSDPNAIILANSLKDKDIPPSCMDVFRQSFYNSQISKVFERLSSQKIIIEGDIFDVFINFIRSAGGITENYYSAGLPIPPDENYLRIIKYKDSEYESELQKYKIFSSKTNYYNNEGRKSSKLFNFEKNDRNKNLKNNSEDFQDENDEFFDKHNESEELNSLLYDDYSSVFKLDLEKNTFSNYKKDNYFSEDDSRELEYSNTIKNFIRKSVYEDDKESLSESISIKGLKTKLAKTKSFVTEFREFKNGVYRYCQVKIVKLEPKNEEPKFVIAGFTEKDKEIYSRIVNEKLNEDFASVYYVDLEHDELKTIVRSMEFNKEEDHDIDCYSEKTRAYAKFVSNEYKNAWINMSDINYMQNYLRDEDRREFVYSMDTPELSWRRVVTRVIARKDGLPIKLILTFMKIDQTSSKKYELDRKISEQKDVLESHTILLEQALQHAETANKAKNTFFSNLSHDMRVPMNSIIGFTNLALNHIDDQEKVQEYLSKAVISSKHLLSLINSTTDMDAIESGKMQIYENNCNINEIVNDISTIMQGQIQSKQQNLVIHTEEVINKDFRSDKLRLEQILINLINNSNKYTPIGGNIELTIKQTSSNETSGSYEFHIKDNGIGMNQNAIDNLLLQKNKETDLLPTTLESRQGLSVCKNIIDLMGGKINIVTEPGRGTEYIIYLTLKYQSQIKENQIFKESSKNFKGKNILLVDDNIFNLEIAKEILQDKGIIVDIAYNGQEAVEKVHSKLPDHYDAILMDIQMPLKNGYEATEEIRNIEGMSKDQLPIIAMTANAFSEDKTKTLNAGMNAHLIKPIVISELDKVLNDYF